MNKKRLIIYILLISFVIDVILFNISAWGILNLSFKEFILLTLNNNCILNILIIEDIITTILVVWILLKNNEEIKRDNNETES